MEFDHAHFFVDNAQYWRDWFVRTLGFEALARDRTTQTLTEVLGCGPVRVVLSAPRTAASPVARYLQLYAPGVADLAFQVQCLKTVSQRLDQHGVSFLVPPREEVFPDGYLRWCRITGWGRALCHTLIERSGTLPLLPHCLLPGVVEKDRELTIPVPNVFGAAVAPEKPRSSSLQDLFVGFDHAVLNVEKGDMEAAASWYCNVFGFRQQQTFEIQTPCSGLRSIVLAHPDGSAKLPINEPTSANSQIQEFLNHHRDAGIQHIALQTPKITATLAQLRQRGLTCLSVPSTYYEELQRRSPVESMLDWDAIADQQLLVDWQPHCPQAPLLQTFTTPIFEQPTFFFELIERKTCRVGDRFQRAEGFGEGNFQALFEAIERSQQIRGTLVTSPMRQTVAKC